MAKKRKTLYLILFSILLAVCILLVGISITYINPFFKPTLLNTRIHSPYKFSDSLQQISADGIDSIVELRVFSNELKSKILKVSLAENGCCVLAVNNSGNLVTWDIAKKTEISRFNIGSVHQSALNFNADSTRLLTPYSITKGGNISGAAIWDTKTGEQIFCNGNTLACRGQNIWDFEDVEGGYFLDPSGQWLLGYYLSNLDNLSKSYRSYRLSNTSVQNVNNLSADLTSGGIVLLDPGKYADDKNAEVTAITTDIDTKYIAYALANGVVRLDSAFAPLSTDKIYQFRNEYSQGYQTERVTVIDMKIDDTRNWLAVLNNKELLVWDLQNGMIFPLAMNEHISDGITICFDHTGNILVFAVKDVIRFYNLSSGKEISSINADGVSSLYITRDNRILIWGDQEGAVHLWGIPQK